MTKSKRCTAKTKDGHRCKLGVGHYGSHCCEYVDGVSRFMRWFK